MRRLALFTFFLSCPLPSVATAQGESLRYNPYSGNWEYSAPKECLNVGRGAVGNIAVVGVRERGGKRIPYRDLTA